MTTALTHRGPDDQGVHFQDGVGLGMRRLSVIDIAGGHQPIANEDNSIWIVFNGEIYNYEALAQSLVSRGHHLRTRSDTEVIVHLYEEYGYDCIQHLDGMFAFAIYDSRPSSKGIFIGRDRIGKKPLYYANSGNALAFGSELKSVLHAPFVSRNLDFDALNYYLSLLVVPAPWTIFQDVRKLEPGHFLTCNADGVKVSQYWDCNDYLHPTDVLDDEDEIVARVRQGLFDAVEKRLVSEVPLGAFLSGGLDSSAVVGVMSQFKTEPIQTFSIGFDGPETHNELSYASQLASHFGTDHHEFLLKPDIVELLPELVGFFDEPFAISSSIPTYLLSRAAKEHVTVVLTGDGGDEVFGGYYQYLYEKWATLYRYLPRLFDFPIQNFARISNASIESSLGRLQSRLSRFVETARLPIGERRLGWASAFSDREKDQLYQTDNGYEHLHGVTAELLDKKIGKGQGSVQQMMMMDFLVWLPDEMLTKVDRMTMGASLEARCPLLDVHLVQLMAGVSPQQKIPGIREPALKYFLKRSVSDILPSFIFDRPKQGFNVPLDYWFRTGARSFVTDTLDRSRIKKRGIFSPDYVSQLLQQHLNGQKNLSNRLYALLVFEIWAENYL